MPLIINTNTMSLNAQRNLTNNTNALSKSLERLSSGYRINRGSDDAAGLQVSENLRTQIRGSKKALDNVQDGINVLNIADGALSVITENLQRIRELAVQAANDTYDATQRDAIQQEINSRVSDIDRIASATEFNGVFLLDGTQNGAGNFTLQVGANEVAANDTIDVGTTGAFANVDSTLIGANAGNMLGNVAVNTGATASADSRTAIAIVDAAIVDINTQRATIGSIVNQLESAAQNLAIGIENVSSSESRVRNVDVAAESAEMVRNQILQNASATVLSQANQAPSLALQLLG